MKITPTTDKTLVFEATRPSYRAIIGLLAVLGGIGTVMYLA